MSNPRSERVHPDTQDLVRIALKKSGLTYEQLSTKAHISRATVSRFFEGRYIDRMNFIEICELLDLEWEEIAYFDQNNVLANISISQETETKEKSQTTKDYNYLLVTQIEELKSLAKHLSENSQSVNINISGHFISNCHGENIGAQYSYLSDDKQDLARAATDIKELLKVLSVSYPEEITDEQKQEFDMALEAINRDKELKDKVMKILKAGSLSALSELQANPYVKIILAAIEGYNHSEEEKPCF